MAFISSTSFLWSSYKEKYLTTSVIVKLSAQGLLDINKMESMVSE
jgi:hypothetical protein